jgi:hypothetical protein
MIFNKPFIFFNVFLERVNVAAGGVERKKLRVTEQPVRPTSHP